MRILLIGSNGTIGKKVSEELGVDHEIIPAGRSNTTNYVNIEEVGSIRDLYDNVAPFGAIICCAGEAKWDYYRELSEDDYYNGIRSKLMGQVNIVRHGIDILPHDGSITLTTGILGDKPVNMTTGAALVNGAIHSFVKAIDLESGNIRINAICPGLVEDSYVKYKDYFPGHTPVPMDRVVEAYRRSVEGFCRGEIIRVFA